MRDESHWSMVLTRHAPRILLTPQFIVSTIYLALAVAQNSAATGRPGRVIATEHEESKAAQARKNWANCGRDVEGHIDLRVGDLLETLKSDVADVDLLLLDSKFYDVEQRIFCR